MDLESPEVIEHEMHQTRQSLTDKVAALESQMTDKFEHATTAVQDTVQTVKAAVNDTMTSVTDKVKESVASVQDSVSSVKATLDVRDQIRAHPWAILAGATVSGAIVGLVCGERKEHGYRSQQRSSSGSSHSASTPMMSAHASSATSKRPGLFDDIWDRLRAEITTLGEAAIATLSVSLKKTVNDNIKNLVDNTLTMNRSGDSDAEPESTQSQSQHGHSNGVRRPVNS